MKYKILANKFLGEQEDDGLSFAGIPAIAVKKFAEWLDAAEQNVQRIDYWFAFMSFLAGLGAGYLMCILSTINR